MLLVLVFCLVGAVLSGQPVANCPGKGLTNDERDALTNIHNEMRSQIVKGAAPNWSGNLNAGENMYELKYDCALEEAAAKAMGGDGVCRQAIAQPPTYGQNVQAYVTKPMIAIAKKDQLEDSVRQWYQPVVQYGLQDKDNKFSDPRLQSFANLAHYKSTKVGCHYEKCTKPTEKVVVTCMYDNPIQPNDTIYPKGTPCQKDDDCTVYTPSTCDTTTQLCQTNANQPATTTAAPQGTMCPNNEMTDAARKRIRAMHNWRRSQLAQGQVKNGRNNYNCSTAANMYKMKYDCELEKSALAYAKQCSLKPSDPATRQGEGENVHSGPLEGDQVKAAATAVKAWWSQIFKNGVNQRMIFLQNLRDKPNAPLAFTQMAWALTTKVGCAVVNCNKSNTFTVCRYKQEGNILNQQIYQVGKPCSACQTSCLGEGLCASP